MTKFYEYITNCIYELSDFYGDQKSISMVMKNLPGASAVVEGALAAEEEYASGECSLEDYLAYMTAMEVCEILQEADLAVDDTIMDLYDRLNHDYPVDDFEAVVNTVDDFYL